MLAPWYLYVMITIIRWVILRFNNWSLNQKAQKFNCVRNNLYEHSNLNNFFLLQTLIIPIGNLRSRC